MKRIALLNVIATLILLSRFSSLLSQSGQGWKADPATVERLLKSQPDINYFEDRVPQYKLPEVLINSKGLRIQNSSAWESDRRQEVPELFRQNVYGRVPSTSCEELRFAMPVDMHMLISLIAPRAVYITSADQDLWADPRGSYLSLFNAMPAYRLYYPEMSLPLQMPPMNSPVISGKAAYHVRDGIHNLLLKDWNWFMDFSDKALK